MIIFIHALLTHVILIHNFSFMFIHVLIFFIQMIKRRTFAGIKLYKQIFRQIFVIFLTV